MTFFEIVGGILDFLGKHWEGVTAIGGGILYAIKNNRRNKRNEKRIKEAEEKAIEAKKVALEADNSIEIEGVRYRSPVQSSPYVMSRVMQIYIDMFQNTKATRYLELYATNGISDLSRVNSEFGDVNRYHPIAKNYSEDIVKRYRDFLADEHYISLMKDTEKYGFIMFTTSEIQSSKIKTIYERENVKHTIWFFLSRRKLFDDDHRYTGNDIVYFCSVSTHEEENFTIDELTYLREKVEEIKQLYK